MLTGDTDEMSRQQSPRSTGASIMSAPAKPYEQSSGGKVRLNLDLSAEVANFLDILAAENSTTKSDVMRRAIALLKVAHDEKKQNRSMGFVRASLDHVLETKIVGVL